MFGKRGRSGFVSVVLLSSFLGVNLLLLALSGNVAYAEYPFANLRAEGGEVYFLAAATLEVLSPDTIEFLTVSVLDCAGNTVAADVLRVPAGLPGRVLGFALGPVIVSSFRPQPLTFEFRVVGYDEFGKIVIRESRETVTFGRWPGSCGGASRGSPRPSPSGIPRSWEIFGGQSVGNGAILGAASAENYEYFFFGAVTADRLVPEAFDLYGRVTTCAGDEVVPLTLRQVPAFDGRPLGQVLFFSLGVVLSEPEPLVWEWWSASSYEWAITDYDGISPGTCK